MRRYRVCVWHFCRISSLLQGSFAKETYNFSCLCADIVCVYGTLCVFSHVYAHICACTYCVYTHACIFSMCVQTIYCIYDRFHCNCNTSEIHQIQDSNFSVQIRIRPQFQFECVQRVAEEIQCLDVIHFKGVAFSVESEIYTYTDYAYTDTLIMRIQIC